MALRERHLTQKPATERKKIHHAREVTRVSLSIPGKTYDKKHAVTFPMSKLRPYAEISCK